MIRMCLYVGLSLFLFQFVSARIAQQEDAEEWRKEKEREKKKLAAKAKRK